MPSKSLLSNRATVYSVACAFFVQMSEDKRLDEILEMIGRIAALDFSIELKTSNANDMVDAIALGLNMLSEELRSNVVEKSKLTEVKIKLEKFAQTVAHDLRSPIHSVTGLVELLEFGIQQNNKTEIEECIQLLRKTAKHMRDLVQGILENATLASSNIKLETIDLANEVEEIIISDGLHASAEIEIKGALPQIIFSRPAIHQVLRNLFSNAVKYGRKEGGKISIQSIEHENYFEIRVSDNGRGIAPEYHERIFEMYERLDEHQGKEGYGVGLATVRSLLANMGERIWVESAIGKGATFSFTISRKRNLDNKPNDKI